MTREAPAKGLRICRTASKKATPFLREAVKTVRFRHTTPWKEEQKRDSGRAVGCVSDVMGLGHKSGATQEATKLGGPLD
jgi:hypothetical protein